MTENNGRTYRIEFYNKTTDGEEKKQATAPTPSNDGTIETPKSEGGTGIKGVDKYFKPLAVYGYAKSVADRVITSNQGMIALTTGYEEYQARVNFSYSVGKSALSIVESIAMGALLGGGVGAVIGGAVSATSYALNLAIRQNEINIAKRQEDTSLFLSRIRMGAGGNRRGASE